MKPYQASNIVPKTAWKWLLLSSLLGGITIGGLTFAVSQLIYLIILFPLGMGFAGGFVNSLAIQQGKVRNSLVGYCFGAITGLSIYGTVHTGEYFSFKQKASEEIAAEFTKINQGSPTNKIDTYLRSRGALVEADKARNELVINAFLKQETGSDGFLGYLKYTAKQGVSIGRFGSQGIKLNETFTWIYWLIELAVIEGLIIVAAKSASQEPFCEGCQEWYKEKERIGNVDGQLSGNFLQLINQDNFSDCGKLINIDDDINIPSLEVYIQCCPSCKDSDSFLTLSKTSLGEKGKLELEEILQGMITHNQEIQIRENIPIQNNEVSEKIETTEEKEIEISEN